MTELKFHSPFYEAYSSQSDIIDLIIDISIEESAAKMGEKFNEIFSIQSKNFLIQKSA